MTSFLLVWTLSTPSDGTFDTGNKQYQAGAFPEAIAAYRQAVDAGQKDSSVFHNLGNALARDAQFPEAAWAYLEALNLAPRSRDTAYNLTQVRKQFPNATHPPRPWFSTLTTQEWWSVFLTVWLIGWSTAVLLRGHWRWTVVALSVPFGLVAMLSTFETPSLAVAMTDTTARADTYDEGPVLFEVAKGSTVAALETRGEWTQVQAFDGKRGWLPNRDVLRVVRHD